MSDGSRRSNEVTLDDDDGMSRVSVTSLCVSPHPWDPPDKGIHWWWWGPLGTLSTYQTRPPTRVLLSVIPGWLIVPRSCLLLLS